MTVQAAIIQYRQEMVSAFQQKRSLLSMCTTKESMMKGYQATFLVNGSPTDTAVTRGQDGDIPYGSLTNTQVTATLVEKHAPYSITGFDVFASQGNQVQALRDQSLAVINREMDKTILAELANATEDFGSGTLTTNTVLGAVAILGTNYVEVEESDNMFGILSPAARAYLYQNTEFSSGDYVEMKPFNGPVMKMWNWGGVNWITSPLVDGMGTSSESLYVFHRSALGYAVNMGEESIRAGYDDQQDRSWSDAKIYHASKILQDSGIIKIAHDGSAFAST